MTHDHSYRVSDGGAANACIFVVGGSSFDIKRKGNTPTNVGSITKEGKTLPKEDYEASSQMPLLIYTMAVGRMSNVGVSVERDADAVSNVRRTGWCFMVVIMSRQHDQKAMR